MSTAVFKPKLFGATEAIVQDLYKDLEMRSNVLKEGFREEATSEMNDPVLAEVESGIVALRVLDQFLQLNAESIKKLEVEKEILQNRVVYFQRKACGDFETDWWVVVANGAVLIHSPSRQEALKKSAEERVKHVYFTKVGTPDFRHRH